MLLERRDDLAGAARSLKWALRINPDYAEARLALATLYERQGDFDLTLYSLGRAEEARREWQQVALGHPECEDAQMYLRLVKS